MTKKIGSGIIGIALFLNNSFFFSVIGAILILSLVFAEILNRIASNNTSPT